MNPDQQKNYWQQDPNEEDAAPVSDQPLPERAGTPLSPADTPVTWSAQEYVHVEKGGLWFFLFTLVVLGLISIDVFLLKSYTFSALVIVMAIAVIVYSRRPPRTLQYALSGQHGLYVGEKLHNLADYKSFGLIRDGEHHSIMLIPTKRFSPGLSVYFPEEKGEQIVDILGTRLPMETLKLDVIDMVVRKLRL